MTAHGTFSRAPDRSFGPRAVQRRSNWPSWLWKAAIFRKWSTLRTRRIQKAAEPRVAKHIEQAHEGRLSPEAELCDRETERELAWLVD